MSVTPEDVVGTVTLAESAPPPVVAAPPLAEVRLPLLDRELSWIEFNRRVLGEAENPGVPLLERLKFLSIAAHNLDEFLMIRVGEVRDIIAARAGPIAHNEEKLEVIR
ncbi:MAG TPA: RNA degradosome polyphosphate kinase, partial [Thermoanaerobaculia bacterium]